MLKNVKVSEAIRERLRQNAMSADEALSRLSGWARGSFHPFLREDFSGDMRLDLKSDAARRNLHLIKKIEQTERVMKSGGETVEVSILKTKIELYDAMDATIQIAKINGQYVDKVEHSGVIDTGVHVIDFTDFGEDED